MLPHVPDVTSPCHWGGSTVCSLSSEMAVLGLSCSPEETHLCLGRTRPQVMLVSSGACCSLVLKAHRQQHMKAWGKVADTGHAAQCPLC